MDGIVCDAIAKRQVLSLRYKDQMRTVEPHLLGYDSDGDLTLSAWQVSVSRPGWRDFHVSKASGIATTGSNFSGPRPGYNPNDSTLDRIVCRL